MIDKGHLYLAFGTEYDKAAAHSVKALRAYSDLPVRVLTNLPEADRNLLWNTIQDVSFKQFKLGLHDREIKTRMIEYTPFKQTLYTDCDTVIHSDEFLDVFNILKKCDIAFPFHTPKESAIRLQTDIYKQAITELNVTQPNLLVLQGGICAFQHNDASKRFFSLWNQYWNLHQLRDMPPLVAAAYNIVDVAIGMLSKEFGFPDSKVIQHFYGWKPPKTSLIPQFEKKVVNESKGRWELRRCFR